MRKVTIEEAECLIRWPKGTVGYREDKEALQKLIEVANVVGFGRMPQLAVGIEKIWRNPETEIHKQLEIQENQHNWLNQNMPNDN